MVVKRLITFLLASAMIPAVSCGWIKTSRPPLESERADATATASFAPVAVRLNATDQGSTADLARLRTRINEIMTARTANGVFKVGSNEIENRVFVEVDPQMPIGLLADIALAVNENGGEARVALAGAMVNTPDITWSYPNPLTLILEAGVKHDYGDAPLWQLYTKEAERYTIALEFVVTNFSPAIVAARATSGSIEISADGNYFLNEPADLTKSQSPDDVAITQRPVSASAIKDEASRLIASADNRGKLTVVASESAPAKSLLDLFERFEGQTIRWQIVVRKPMRQKP